MRRSLLGGGSALLLSAGLGIALLGAPAAAQNPPGNNGTVKIDDLPFDDHPNNEPHVGCTFQVDFYGYDEGDLDAEVIFEAWPPTLRESGDQTLLTDEVFIGEDDNSGGGSEAGLDASATYTLDVSGITPHPQQGVHVKLTVHAEGSQGADVKHKVFWVQGCAATPTPITSTPAPTTSPSKSPTKSPSHSPTKSPTKSPSHSPTKSPAGSPTGSPTESPTQSASPTPTSTMSPGPAVAPSGPTKTAGTRLPITGGGLAAALLGLVLLGGGAMLLALGRRRTS